MNSSAFSCAVSVSGAGAAAREARRARVRHVARAQRDVHVGEHDAAALVGGGRFHRRVERQVLGRLTLGAVVRVLRHPDPPAREGALTAATECWPITSEIWPRVVDAAVLTSQSASAAPLGNDDVDGGGLRRRQVLAHADPGGGRWPRRQPAPDPVRVQVVGEHAPAVVGVALHVAEERPLLVLELSTLALEHDDVVAEPSCRSWGTASRTSSRTSPPTSADPPPCCRSSAPPTYM